MHARGMQQRRKEGQALGVAGGAGRNKLPLNRAIFLVLFPRRTAIDTFKEIINADPLLIDLFFCVARSVRGLNETSEPRGSLTCK